MLIFNKIQKEILGIILLVFYELQFVYAVSYLPPTLVTLSFGNHLTVFHSYNYDFLTSCFKNSSLGYFNISVVLTIKNVQNIFYVTKHVIYIIGHSPYFKE